MKASLIKETQKQLLLLNNKINNTKVNNFNTYKIIKILIKKKNSLERKLLILQNGELKYQIFSFLKKIADSDHRTSYKQLNAEQLYEYIQYIEGIKDEKILPTSISRLDGLARVMKQNEILNLKIAYYDNTIFKNLKAIKQRYIDKFKEGFEKKQKDFITYINDFKRVIGNKFHAKLVLRLENIKKTELNFNNDDFIIKLSNVSKYYANKYIAFKVFKDINLQIKAGEFVVILGPSGSGKTTLLNIISGMDNATNGNVVIANESLINKRGSKLTTFRRQNVGYVFQQYGLLPNLTVRENVEIGWDLQNDKSKRLNINEVLNDIGMYEYRNKFPYELSGGQQQRVSIARSLAKNPNLLFGDEPTGAVDEKTSKEILKLFVEVNKKYHNTVVIVTHNQLIAKMATKVIMVNNGMIEKVITNIKPKTVDEIKWSYEVK
ncbi:MAG: ATP-binding cassette domain-containing protein [Mycoplasmataceae bacterium]|jgi:putative ABC transport system ATP-binding protein|nr:ATP-binding cassette domain-containing protein [Mycoplasmataceae bacterium]